MPKWFSPGNLQQIYRFSRMNNLKNLLSYLIAQRIH